MFCLQCDQSQFTRGRGELIELADARGESNQVAVDEDQASNRRGASDMGSGIWVHVLHLCRIWTVKTQADLSSCA